MCSLPIACGARILTPISPTMKQCPEGWLSEPTYKEAAETKGEPKAALFSSITHCLFSNSPIWWPKSSSFSIYPPLMQVISLLSITGFYNHQLITPLPDSATSLCFHQPNLPPVPHNQPATPHLSIPLPLIEICPLLFATIQGPDHLPGTTQTSRSPLRDSRH